MTNYHSPDLESIRNLASRLQILLLDVDGVLTDGGIILVGREDECKRFDVQDGMGIALAKTAGLKIGIITSRKSDVVSRRAAELQIDNVFQGAGKKTDILDNLLDLYKIDASQAAYIGDDIQDIGVMTRVGIPIAVQNARSIVKENSVYVTNARGGYGAGREAVEWLLELRGDLNSTFDRVIG